MPVCACKLWSWIVQNWTSQKWLSQKWLSQRWMEQQPIRSLPWIPAWIRDRRSVASSTTPPR